MKRKKKIPLGEVIFFTARLLASLVLAMKIRLFFYTGFM